MPWMGAMNATLTAFAGPWGVSYAANLTPDKVTGLGTWTEQNFVDALKTQVPDPTPPAAPVSAAPATPPAAPGK
jgi:hypothetical protein